MIINSSLLSGKEDALFEVCVSRDIHMGPGVLLLESYMQKSSFIDTLQMILSVDGLVCGGNLKAFEAEIVSNNAMSDIKGHVIASDYSDLIDITSIEVVPGIFCVTARIGGETKVSALRALDKIVLDRLFVEIITDYFLLQAGGPTLESR